MKVQEALKEIVMILRGLASSGGVTDEARVEACSVILRTVKLRCGLTAKELEEEI